MWVIILLASVTFCVREAEQSSASKSRHHDLGSGQRRANSSIQNIESTFNESSLVTILSCLTPA